MKLRRSRPWYGRGGGAPTSAGGSKRYGSLFRNVVFAHAHFGDGGILGTGFTVARSVVSHYALYVICFHVYPSFICVFELFFCSMNWARRSEMQSTLAA